MVKALADRFLPKRRPSICVPKSERKSGAMPLMKCWTMIHSLKKSMQVSDLLPGYPACPDHTEKKLLWSLLDLEDKIGITLTESMAMHPAASVSGWYFLHIRIQYFGISEIHEDQLTDYCTRKKWDLSTGKNGWVLSCNREKYNCIYF
ncbi:MAG: hypothetical protein IPI30_14115 [Saprospiraceae bacterium]|nr:hypothetical protein [Candidatus Vicinibacter affinis]